MVSGAPRALIPLCLLVMLVSELTAQVSVPASDEVGARVVLSGSRPPDARAELDRGPLDLRKRLARMILVLRPSAEQREALDRLLADQQNPASPDYHRWLTPEEFGRRFGAGQADLDRVAAWLRAQGFMVESTARGRRWVTFSGTAGQASRAFRVEFRRYQTRGRMRFAPAGAPSVPADLAPLVAHVGGLDDFTFEPPRRMQPMTNLVDGTHALSPGDLRTIYGYSRAEQNWTGQGQTIAIAGQSAIDLADIQQFRSLFQLPPNDPETILVGDDPGIDTAGGGFLEGEADVEWAGALASNAHIVYVYAQDAADAAREAIDRNLAPILSFSFGTCEPNLTDTQAGAIRDLAQQANAQGITWVAASGDSGPAACDAAGSSTASHGLAVSFPASLPEVTAVGGTGFDESDGKAYWQTLNFTDLSSAIDYIPEAGWNDSSPDRGIWASGGGASSLYHKPSWQNGPGGPTKDARHVPDLALAASPFHDPYVVISGGKTLGGGGTSFSAPIFAATLALAEEAIGQTPGTATALGNVNPSLYTLAVRVGDVPVFHDVTKGNSVAPCADGSPDCVNGSLGYAAGPGYDLVTGLGTLNAHQFLDGLGPATTTTLTASTTQAAYGVPVTFTATVREANGRVPFGFITIQDGPLSIFGAPLDSAGVSVNRWAPVGDGNRSVTARFVPQQFRTMESTSTPVMVLVIPPAPPAPKLISPADKSTGAPVGVAVSWGNVVDPIDAFDVYFGRESDPPFVATVKANASLSFLYAPVGMTRGVTYYWRVVAKNYSGATSSATWSFTTNNDTVYLISTVAGTGVPGFSGDGGPATLATLQSPTDVAVDAAGRMCISDLGNFGRGFFRVVSPDGTISSPAQADLRTSGYGVVMDRDGNCLVAGNNTILKIAPDGTSTVFAGGNGIGYGGDGGPATAAKLNNPAGMAFDAAGNLYVADALNNCVRKISGGTISALAGVCTSGPKSDGDGGPAAAAHLATPTGVAVDSSGALYIAQYAAVRKVSNGVITTVANLTANRLAVDSGGTLFFTDFQQVGKLVNGGATTIAGLGANDPGDGGPGASVKLADPVGIALGPDGKIYFAEYGPRPRIRMLTPQP